MNTILCHCLPSNKPTHRARTNDIFTAVRRENSLEISALIWGLSRQSFRNHKELQDLDVIRITDDPCCLFGSKTLISDPFLTFHQWSEAKIQTCSETEVSSGFRQRRTDHPL
ncbi:hypothetical protein CHARACLAT_032406 [Characodon lateralis]|uniref:Uncharacterized protein n=1 Tax=Characodon lateralis TaxID=208331 RepID=A0ABU7E8K1_9TELE|nr:hypothetical protein [Characodon lateralis]